LLRSLSRSSPFTTTSWRSNAAADVPKYRTESVTRGNLDVKGSATGTLQPTNKVEVGSELSGLIETVFVDENDTVKKGQELARLDCPYQKRRKRCAD
jgi:HlyD family secretion protein